MARPRYSFGIKLYADDKADPQAIGEFIEDLIVERNEHVTAEELVAAGRPASSPLHPCFTWNENEAADKCRRREAKAIIKALRVEKDDRKTMAFEYVHHPDHEGKRVLMSLHSIVGNQWMMEEVSMRGAKHLQRQLHQWVTRFGAAPETKALAKDVKALQKKIERSLRSFV